MSNLPPFVDIHCHLLPRIDDGAKSWVESLTMAEIAVSEGITTSIVTPHQLGTFSHNRGDKIRGLTAELQQLLDERGIPLRVLPGADVRIDPGLVPGLQSGDILTLADQRRHVLLELPHELYMPLEDVLARLERAGIAGILSHPERNQGLIARPELVESLVHRGCLMQVTAGSLLGAFGPQSQSLAEWMVQRGLVQFLATDAHGPKSRRPLMLRAYERVAQLGDTEQANQICSRNPAAVAAGEPVSIQLRATPRRGLASWFRWKRAA